MENNEKVNEEMLKTLYKPIVEETMKTLTNNETENKPVDPVQKEAEELQKENERRETLRHKVVADFVTMCAEFLYNEYLNKLKEMEQKDAFFESIKE